MDLILSKLCLEAQQPANKILSGPFEHIYSLVYTSDGKVISGYDTSIYSWYSFNSWNSGPTINNESTIYSLADLGNGLIASTSGNYVKIWSMNGTSNLTATLDHNG